MPLLLPLLLLRGGVEEVLGMEMVSRSDEGDDHQGGLPPHTLLRFVGTLVLLPLAQSCWRQTVCHSGGSGNFSLWRRWREDPSLRFTFLLQPFYREGFARGSRQLEVPSQRHH